MSWAVVLNKGERHVIPVDDSRMHSESADCWCRPKVDRKWDGDVIVHHSLDGREHSEPDLNPDYQERPQ